MTHTGAHAQKVTHHQLPKGPYIRPPSPTDPQSNITWNITPNITHCVIPSEILQLQCISNVETYLFSMS
jgi:hypothetical protein